ncbi:beta-ketoacyl synthase chain length factor [Leptothrix discophora]|uniref:Beta-ketoacyl synthase chain length factor n=1 Tax=Leptothrix discophora TaxID=89 RepID=A0ABT9G921_LEPDI|nr:beta-ketoacyl synthase chain length factor [Leptothrix discophora]MDP4302895.1 beta-ketoacyl synthase chain length factor [Leptothrix discophora]
MSALTLYIDGIACWSPAWPDWATAAAALRDEVAGAAVAPQKRPAATMLAANERRRAPDSVLLALEVAQAAVAAAGLADDPPASVFASTHGDLAIVDALCSTLAADPLLLSPTRFHHSVHNAASGYWAIASGCGRGSSAVAQQGCTFAAGLLEAAGLCAADDAPVLLVGLDTAAAGRLAEVHADHGLLAFALVLSPHRTARSTRALRLAPGPVAARTALHSAAARALAGHAMADALPLAEALASLDTSGTGPLSLDLPLDRSTGGTGLAIGLERLDTDPAGAGQDGRNRPEA